MLEKAKMLHLLHLKINQKVMIMGWFPKRTPRRTPPTASKSKTIKTSSCNLDSPTVIAFRISKQIESRKKEDTPYKDLQKILHRLENTPCPVTHPVSPEQLYRYDRRMGRSTSYYVLEEDALYHDLEYVVRTENISTVKSALERRERQIKREICRFFSPFQNLDDAQKMDVLTRLGLNRSSIDELEPMPLNVGKYKINLTLKTNETNADDQYIPERDIEEIFEERQNMVEASSKQATQSRLIGANLTHPGQKIMIIYASSKEKDQDFIPETLCENSVAEVDYGS
jgi:hypothetical protein